MLVDSFCCCNRQTTQTQTTYVKGWRDEEWLKSGRNGGLPEKETGREGKRKRDGEKKDTFGYDDDNVDDDVYPKSVCQFIYINLWLFSGSKGGNQRTG